MDGAQFYLSDEKQAAAMRQLEKHEDKTTGNRAPG